MIEIRKIEEVRRGVDIPEITGIYDPLSGKKDGTITPWHRWWFGDVI